VTEETDKKQKKFLEYKPHPLAELLPEMGEDELWQLAKDIAKPHDLLEPIVLYEGKILDGRNRHKACQLIHRPFTEKDFIEFDESWGIDPFDFVESKNFHRRHLTTWQRAKWGLIHLEREREKAKERQEKTQLAGKTINGKYKLKEDSGVSNLEPTDEEFGKSLVLAAKKVSVSPQTLWQVEKIVLAAETDSEIKVKVEKLDKVKKLAKTEKRVSIASVFNAIRGKEREQKLQERAKKPQAILGRIIHGDFFDKIRKIKDDSIDLLFVDPPYNILPEEWDTLESRKEFRAFCESWLNLVVPKVKDTGRIYICLRQEQKYLFYSFMQQNSKLFLKFNFGQEIIWHYKKKKKPSNKKLYHFAYEPIFYLYGKNADELNFPPESSGETQSNVWTIAQDNYQKPLELLRRIILTGSREDDVILDPFARSGTTGVVCGELQRNYILIEKDKEQVELAKDRIKGRLSE